MPKIGGAHTETIDITGSGRTWTFKSNFTVDAPDLSGIAEDSNVQNNRIILHGIADSDPSAAAIYLRGENTRLKIAEDGRIRGDGVAIDSGGEGAEIVNEGAIKGGAVFVNGGNSEFRNFGTVAESASIYGENSRLINEKGGSISGDYGAVYIGTLLFFSTNGKFVNHGKVEVLIDPETNSAVTAGNGNDRVINDGKIIGNIWMADGNDLLDNRGGKLDGVFYGSGDNDTLITDKASDTLFELVGEGSDTIKSTVTYTLTQNVERLFLIGNKDVDAKGNGDAVNHLRGNAGDNTLWGYEGADWLDGKAGNDVLRGGTEEDTFLFGTGYDKDTIYSLEQGLDHIDLTSWKAIGSFNAVKNHAENHGDDVWIQAGGDTLVIRGLNKTDLSGADFDF